MSHQRPAPFVQLIYANFKNAGRRGEGTLIHCWWECKLVQPLWKTIWRLFRKLNIDLPYDPAIPLLGIYPKECNSGYSISTAHPCLFQH
jgi:hypothetical protein